MKRALTIAAILYFFFIGGIAMTSTNAVFLIILHSLASVLGVVWVIGLIRHRQTWPITRLDWILGSYVVWLGVTTIFSQNSRVSAEYSWVLVITCLWFYIIVDMMRQGHQRWLMESLFLTGGIAIVLGIFEFVSWYWGVGVTATGQGWAMVGGLHDPIPPIFYKLQLLMNGSNQLGTYTLLTLPVVVAWIRTTQRRDYQIGLSILALGVVWLMVMSGARGAWGAAFTVVGVMLAFQLIHWRLLPERLILIALAVGVVVIALGLWGYAFQSDSASDQRRVDLWKSALKMTEQDPLTGVGVYRFGVEYRQYRNTSFIQDRMAAAHNVYLNTMAEIGVLGLVLLLALGVTFMRSWWQVWRAAAPPQQIRLEGILAGLVGYSVHSMVDAFTWPTALILSIYGAYVVSQITPTLSRPRLVPVYHAVPYVALIGIIAFGVWMIQIDRAGVALLRAIVAINQDNYATALKQLDRAERLDPALGLYQLDRAYVLGLMAAKQPQPYLEQAIAAYEQSLIDNPTFDMGLANIAALYLQQDNPTKAVDRLETAVAVNPGRWQLWVMLGQAYERLDETEKALLAYQRGLWLYPAMSPSLFWQQTSTRQMSLRAAYENAATPEFSLLLAVYQHWLEEAEAVLPLVTPMDWQQYWILGQYAMLRGDYTRAVDYYDQAITLDWREIERGELYAARAEAHFALGNDTAAKDDAKVGIFLSPVEGVVGYWILAQIELKQPSPNQELIDDYLKRAVIPNVIFLEYHQVVYGRLGWVDYLPQSRLPGLGIQAYQPWFLLAERYATDNDPNTDPADIYKAIMDDDSYLTLPE